VSEVCLGLGYTAVALSNGQVGIAYTFLDGISGGCSIYDGRRPLAGRPAEDLLSWFDSDHPLDSALALACANALFNTPGQSYSEGASITQLDFRPDDRVGMIGYFAPIVGKIRDKVADIAIFERQARPAEGILGFDQTQQVLPNCQLALISSTSIINNTIDDILARVGHCREVVMLGTSTPMLAAAFAETPVTLLSGIAIDDAAGVLQVVKEGGGTPAIRPFSSKVNLRCGENIS
jgi:uncharacterized protein (DUF4213/DUF364 family)